jgi:hypothetical protein
MAWYIAALPAVMPIMRNSSRRFSGDVGASVVMVTSGLEGWSSDQRRGPAAHQFAFHAIGYRPSRHLSSDRRGGEFSGRTEALSIVSRSIVARSWGARES